MTEAEAIEAARSVALDEGWPWEEPVQARVEKSFILFGRRTWYVRTNASHLGRNVNVRIDDETGNVVSRGFARM